MAMLTSLTVATVLSAWAAQRLATIRGRAPRNWMIAAILLGPLPLVPLAVLPNKRTR
jgi:hypothetical protein